MKAWRVELNDCDMVYVLSETRSKAISKALTYDESGEAEYVGCRALRYADLDGDCITHQALVARGEMWTECVGCTGRVTAECGYPARFTWDRDETSGEYGPSNPRYPDEETTPIWIDPYTVFCCETCRDEHPAIKGNPGQRVAGVFLSTEY